MNGRKTRRVYNDVKYIKQDRGKRPDRIRVIIKIENILIFNVDNTV